MYIMLDTETTNDIDCPLVYDLGFCVLDDDFKVRASYSFVNADIFCDDELMASAFYSDKIAQYWEDIRNGERVLKSFRSIERIFHRVCRDWRVNTFIAHNARFDYRALQNTKRYITTSKYRFFFPFRSKFVDTLKMSREVFKNDEDYRLFCVQNDYITKYYKNRYTAEIIYRYLSGNNEFIESHTGLQDCLIEKDIFKHCMGRVSLENGYLW